MPFLENWGSQPLALALPWWFHHDFYAMSFYYLFPFPTCLLRFLPSAICYSFPSLAPIAQLPAPSGFCPLACPPPLISSTFYSSPIHWDSLCWPPHFLHITLIISCMCDFIMSIFTLMMATDGSNRGRWASLCFLFRFCCASACFKWAWVYLSHLCLWDIMDSVFWQSCQTSSYFVVFTIET